MKHRRQKRGAGAKNTRFSTAKSGTHRNSDKPGNGRRKLPRKGSWRKEWQQLRQMDIDELEDYTTENDYV